MFRRHPILSIATISYLVVVCVLTLNPSINNQDSSWSWSAYLALRGFEPTSWMTFDGIEFVINVVMFIPVGILFLLLLGRRRWPFAVVFGVVGSCWIELAQHLWLPDRIADPRDILSNSLGIIFGVIIAASVMSARPRRATTTAKPAAAA